MRGKPRLILATIFLLAVFGSAHVSAREHHALSSAAAQDAGSRRFDHLMLSLSWSPEFCASNTQQKESEQCRKPYGWVLHGLWPQAQKGAPQYCPVAASWIPEAVLTRYRQDFPSKSLMLHQWKKHGSCFANDAQTYFSASSALWQKVKSWIPPTMKTPADAERVTVASLKQGFIDTAKIQGVTLMATSMALFCSDGGRYLRELRVCFNREQALIACSAETQQRAAKSCAQPTLIIRPF